MYNNSSVPFKLPPRNVLDLEIPGFPSKLQLSFPDGRLPVCTKCKKNFKTRDMCRVHGGHTSLPWTSVYACITLDDSCIDSNKKLKKGDYTAKNIGFSSFCYREDVPADTLICASCKVKNYTRKQCRVKSKHRALPWSTIFIKLFCDETTTDSSDHDETQPMKKRKIESGEDSNSEKAETKTTSSDDKEEKNDTSSEKENVKDDNGDGNDKKEKSVKEEQIPDTSDDINNIPDSKTFLLEISTSKCVVKWLENDKHSPFVSAFMYKKSSEMTPSRRHNRNRARQESQEQEYALQPSVASHWNPQRSFDGYIPGNQYPPNFREQSYPMMENPYFHQVVQLQHPPLSSLGRPIPNPRSVQVYANHYPYYQDIYEPPPPAAPTHYVQSNWYGSPEQGPLPQVRPNPPRRHPDQNDVYPYVRNYHV